MHITKINDYNKNHTFKKSLTSYEINKVRNMHSSDFRDIIQRLKNVYDINADINNNNTVAFCVEECADIMKRAGFSLPKFFKFSPLRKNILGSYVPNTDTVYINSNESAFYDLENQNRLEESGIGYHPYTGHFLHTYLHEFSHAAHYKYLLSKHGKERGNQIFWGFLTDNSPNNIIIGPLNAIIKNHVPKFAHFVIDSIITPSNGLYSKEDLTEYMAEYNSRMLAEELGPQHIKTHIKSNFTNLYTERPYNWDFYKEVSNTISCTLNIFEQEQSSIWKTLFGSTIGTSLDIITKIVDTCKQELKYINNDIWNGNINNLNENSVLWKN